jgi:hypothetical protein
MVLEDADIRNEVLECGKPTSGTRASAWCQDDPAAFNTSVLRSRDRTRFVFNKLFSNAHLATLLSSRRVNDGAFVQATEVSMSFVADNALMAAAQLPHVLRMDKATIDKDMARCLIPFNVRVVERPTSIPRRLYRFLRLPAWRRLLFPTKGGCPEDQANRSTSLRAVTDQDQRIHHTNETVEDEDMSAEDEGENTSTRTTTRMLWALATRMRIMILKMVNVEITFGLLLSLDL